MPRILASEYCAESGGVPACALNDCVSVMPTRVGRDQGSAHRHKFVFEVGPADDSRLLPR
jgi:hypothetical protein